MKVDAGAKLILSSLDELKGYLWSRLGGDGPGPTTNFEQLLEPNGTHVDVRHIQGDASRSDPVVNGMKTMNIHPAIASSMDAPAASSLRQIPRVHDLTSKQHAPDFLLQSELTRPLQDFREPDSLDFTQTSTTVRIFFDNVHPWLGIIDPTSWPSCYDLAQSQGFREGAESCLVLLVLALGSICYGNDVLDRPPDAEQPGMQYFCAAWAILSRLTLVRSTVSLQCAILASAYLMYSMRPLDAWNLLSSTTNKMQLHLMSQQDVDQLTKVANDKVLWNAVLLEKSLRAELELPPLGLDKLAEASQRSNAPLAWSGDNDTWYLQPQIQFHQLVQRITTTVYAHGPSSLPNMAVCVELDAQLSAWYKGLANINHPASITLQIRLFAARVLIFRPFLVAALCNEGPSPPDIIEGCNFCLDSCIRSMNYVGALNHNEHWPYLWQAVQAISGHTLLVMGATRSNTVSGMLPEGKVDETITDVVNTVEKWGRLAPSLKLIGEVLREVEQNRRPLTKGA